MTFIPKGLITRNKKSTKRHIELREFPRPNPCRGFMWTRCKKPSFSNTPFSNTFAHLVFVTFWKTFRGFSLLSTITVAWHREAEPKIQGTKIWRGCRLRNHWLTIVLCSHKNRQISRKHFHLINKQYRMCIYRLMSMYALFLSQKMVKILQQRLSSLSNFHSRNAYSPIFARGFSLEPCNPGRPALRKWWHTILERFRVFFCFWEEDLSFSVPVRHSKSNLLSTTTLSTLSVTLKPIWPFPSSKKSYFRNEAKFKTFLVASCENEVYQWLYTLKERLELTSKWPIEDKNQKIVKITSGTCFQTETAVFII